MPTNWPNPAVSKEAIAVIAILTFQLASRGADYLSGNPKPGVGAIETSDYTPAMVWGICCVIVAGVVAVGLATKSLRTVRDGACLAICIYLSFAVLVVDDAFRDGLDDWRFCTGYLAAAGLWGVMAWYVTMRMAVAASREGEHEHRRDGGATRDD